MIEAAKSAAGLLSAGLAGFVLGMYAMARIALDELVALPGSDMPAWVATAERVWFVAIVGMCVAAVAWMYVDYRYEVDA